MLIVCDQNMPLAVEAFSTLGEVRVVDGRQMSPHDVRDADLLAIRSTTRVNEALLGGSRVRFVGTATIGTDHMDLAWLERAGIAWCHAPGCNANSVSEYVTAALLRLWRHRGLPVMGRVMGIVGVGCVGRLVAQKAAALGMKVLQNDPPRERAEGGAQFVSLDALLAESDVVTLHVPLNRDGVDCTVGMANEDFFRKMKREAVFINAARGAVVRTAALVAAREEGRLGAVVLDTWEGEPALRADALRVADLGTPHIAGHSFEGKVMGTAMVYRAACRFLGLQPKWSHEPFMPAPLTPWVETNAMGREWHDVLAEVVHAVYDIEADDCRLRACLNMTDAERAAHFDRLRRDYPERREFPATQVRAAGGDESLKAAFRGLGFKVAV